MTTGQVGLPAAARQPLGRELAHRLEQRVARARSGPVDPDQRAVDERAQRLRHAWAAEHRHRVVGGERPREHRETREGGALVIVEARLGPLEHRRRGSVGAPARGGAETGARASDWPSSASSSASDIVDSCAAAISIASGKPSSRVTTRATSSSSTSMVRSGATAAARCTRSRRAGAPDVSVASGATGRTCSPSTPRRSRLVASTRERVTAADSARDDMGRGVEHVLGVVEHEEDVEGAGPVECRERCLALSGEAERGDDGVGDAGGVADLCELDEPGAERPAARRDPSSLDREPRLADATRGRRGSRSASCRGVRRGVRTRRRDRRTTRPAWAAPAAWGRGATRPSRARPPAEQPHPPAPSARSRAVRPTARDRPPRARRRRVGTLGARRPSAPARPDPRSAASTRPRGAARRWRGPRPRLRPRRPGRRAAAHAPGPRRRFAAAPPGGAPRARCTRTSACSANAGPRQSARASSRSVHGFVRVAVAAASRRSDSKRPASTSSGAATSA